MRYLLTLFVALSVSAQPNPIWRKLIAVPTAISNPDIPHSIAHFAFFLNYNDLPHSNYQAFWTDEVASIVFTNKGSTIPTNSPSGMYFDGTTGNYFLHSNAPVRIDPELDAIWFCVTVNAFDALGCIFSDSNVAGHGYFVDTSGGNNFSFSSSSSPPISRAVTGVQYNVATSTNTPNISPGGAHGVQSWTNGVSVTHGWNYTPAINTNFWGVGRDANSDANARVFVKFIGIWTNYTFTSTDISNLNYYAAHN